jgi:hypothetical protein
LSEKDLLEALGTANAWSGNVDRIMTTRVIQYEPDAPAQVIFDFLRRVHLRRVVIVENSRPVGTVSRESFLRIVQNSLGQSLPETSDPAQRLRHTAEALKLRAHVLRGELQKGSDQSVETMLSSVASIQDLLDDLLSWSAASPTAVLPVHS